MAKKIGIILISTLGGAVIGALVGGLLKGVGIVGTLLIGFTLGIIVSSLFVYSAQVNRLRYLVIFGWIFPVVFVCVSAYLWFMVYLFEQSALGAEIFGALVGAMVGFIFSVVDVRKRVEERYGKSQRLINRES